jgi:central kinetochore subunit Mal2/MCM21
MALVASPPPEDNLTDAQQAQLDDLDLEIEAARSALANLDKRNDVLAASLLASDQIQQQLRQEQGFDDHNGLLDNRLQHCQTNIHRLAYGVTTFPFVDPAPNTSNRPLLGIRFDIHRRGGLYGPAYYVFCKRAAHDAQELTLFKHTLPAFIPVDRYRERFLPLADEGYGSEDSVHDIAVRQDIEAFVGRIRSDLVGWHLRQDAIAAARRKLGLDAESATQDDNGTHDIISFEAETPDANYIRLTWLDGRFGRLRLGNSLHIEKAVVFAEVNGQQQRDDETESAIMAQNAALDTLTGRLQLLYLRRESRDT